MGQQISNIKEPIAIVGQSVLFPDSLDSESFWKHILQGHDLISDVPSTHWLTEDYYDPDPSAPDKTYGNRGGFVPHVDFDSLGWGVPPSIIEATDSTQLLALMVAKRCLEDFAGEQIADLDRSNISVILGVTSAQKLLGHMTARLQRPIWENAMRQEGLGEDEVQKVADRIADHYVPWQESTFPGLLGNVVAGRIANRLDLGGTNCVTDAACASAFSAISMAINELYLGDSKVVLAGGADTMSDILMHMCFSKTPALSKTGDVRPFSDQADGTLLGEGFAMFAFKRLADAEADGDQIYGVLKGLGASSDGRAKSVYAPLAEGQAQAYRRAYANGGVLANTIEMVEAHGTGTKAGDAAEFKGLQQVFSEGNAGLQSVALGSVKSQIGHTKATAGAAGFFKALMALRSQTLPPTIKVAKPNPNLNIESSPLYINTESRPWIRDHSHPRRAGVSAFGFGGSNFHIVLEEYKGANAAPRLRSLSHELCVYASDTADGLESLLRSVLERDERVSFARLAWESQQAFDASLPHRLTMVATDRTDLIEKLQSALSKGFESAYTLPTGVFYASGAGHTGEIGFLFPGQGAQVVNMGSHVAQAFPQSMEVWDFAAEIDRINKRDPLHKVVFPIPAFTEVDRKAQQTHLTKTQWAQPAIGVTSLALLNLLKDLKLEASRCAGHSYGELTALYYAGAYNEQHFIETSQKRGELMNAAAELPGAMSAVKGSAKKIQPLLDEWNKAHNIEVVIANHNSPKQSVLSGPVPDIEKVESLLEEAGMFAQRLGVATAFHSKVVAGSVGPFESYLRGIPLKTPTKPIYANLTAKPYDDQVVATLSKQIASPVRFVEVVEQMYADGVRTFVEVGPGQILGKLAKSILRKKEANIVSLDRPKQSDLRGLLTGLAELLSLGIPMDLNALWTGYDVPVNFDDLRKPRMTISINGANYNKPYPPKEGAAGRAKPNPPRSLATSNTVESSISSHTDPKPVTAPTAPVATPSKGATMSNSINPEWLKAFQQAQQQTAAAHAAYQQAMSNAHIAYLQAAQASLTGLAALAGGTPVTATQAPIQFQAPVAAPQPVVMPQAAPAPVMAPVSAPVPAPMTQAPVATPVAASVQVVPAPAPKPIAVPTPAPVVAPVASAASGSVDVLALLLDVVAEKTGYPAETLDLSLSLEGDLGIDSIKRVEILSSVREREPALPEIDGSQMAQLQTLGEIVDFLGGSVGGDSSTDVSTSVAESSIDVTTLLLDVVAEKTGYPAETLDLSLSLEGDLGIDSIKRVEILSSVREREPALPEIDGSQMAQLQTLGEIIGFLQGDNRDFSQAEVSVVDASAEIAQAVESETSVELETAEEEVEVTETLKVLNRSMVWNVTEPSAITRWVVVPVDTPASGLTHTALHQCKIGIIGDDELAPMLALQLQREGVNAHVVEDLSNIQADIQGLIDLTPLQVAAETVYSSAQQCFERAQVLVQRHANDPKVFIVVSQLGGDFGQTSLEYSDCLQGGTAGVVRTAQQEWPNAHCKNIDIPPRLPINQQARMLVDEILFGGMDLDVGLNFADSAVRRRTLTMTVQEPTGQLCQFSRGDVLVVSGGGRGVTADCLIQMVHHYFDVGYIIPRIVLLGRTPLDGPAFDGLNTESEILKAILTQAKEDGKLMKPAAAKRAAQKVLSAREIQRTIQILENFGAEVRYLSVDVSDTEEVVALFQKLNWGPVTGIIHGAGVLADKAIKDKSSDDFAWVFDVKVQGMEALFNLLDQQYPKLAVFFSSVAARTGNAGQVDYAAANEVLNRVAHYTKQRFPHMCVRSIGWGPWEGGMVSPELARHFASRGVGLIPIRDGAEAFVRELTDESHVEVVIGADAGLDSANQIDSVSWSIMPTTQDFLQGHTFQETVLVPMALVVSAFRRVAEQLGQGVRLNKLNVFNPVHIQDGLKIQHTSNSGRLQLMSVDGKPLYGVQLGTASNEPVSFNTIDEWEKLLTRDGIYDGAVLFHTDDFQVIDSLQVHRDAAMATISVNGPFSDVLALDAGLQLALHWMAYRTGLRSLPMSMDSIQWYSDASVTHVRLEGFSVENKVGRCDLFLLDADGSLVVHMQGVSVVGLVEATQ